MAISFSFMESVLFVWLLFEMRRGERGEVERISVEEQEEVDVETSCFRLIRPLIGSLRLASLADFVCHISSFLL